MSGLKATISPALTASGIWSPSAPEATLASVRPRIGVPVCRVARCLAYSSRSPTTSLVEIASRLMPVTI